MSENIKSAIHPLAALPAKKYKHLLPKLEKFSLTYAATIFRDKRRIISYFEDGLIKMEER